MLVLKSNMHYGTHPKDIAPRFKEDPKMKFRYWLACILAVAFAFTGRAQDDVGIQNFLGVSAHYWQSVKDIKIKEMDGSTIAWGITYQLQPMDFVILEVDVELMPQSFADAEDDFFAPQVLLLVGDGLYAGIGVGRYFNASDSEWSDLPFYELRAGISLELMPYVSWDLFANYVFSDWDDLKDSDADIGAETVTLGTAVRLEI